MHENERIPGKNRAPMIRYHSHKQLSLEEFDWPFQTVLAKYRTKAWSCYENQGDGAVG